ncbi:hypothetical protein C2869_01355 [Saccharobesus litoralis]|uniref:Uncharacterized protein n=1 Tax=Saccharobesus litoralis TaxID=2172099 RepID=A0A2S0VLW5_9ALTE|nr:hypothetical protein [Saccharobesus litoralis]AWB65172.1 hypothetical protein C2869_01355 [Saccharobesus litoralis]
MKFKYSFAILNICFCSNLFATEVTKLTLDVGLQHDNNVTNALSNIDKIEDTLAQANVAWKMQNEYTLGKMVSMGANIKHSQFNELTRMNNTQIGGFISYGWQNQFNYLAPFYKVTVKYNNESFNDEARNSKIWQLDFVASKRITHKLTSQLGLSGVSKSSRKQIFNNRQIAAFANIDYQFSQSITAYLGLNYAKGQLTTMARAYDCQEQMAYQAEKYKKYANKAWQDTQMSKDYCGDWWVYQFDGQTKSMVLGGNYLINHKMSLDLSFLSANAKADYGATYKRNNINLALIYLF